MERIKLAKGVYTKDANGNIQVDPIFNSSSSNSTYISNFNPNYKYIILYSTPNDNLEKDVTAQVVDIVKGFEKDAKGNSYRDFNATKLKQI